MGLIIARMVPGFRAMQERIDAVNRVLREQITGIRVVRAFVREPYEVARFGEANDELTSDRTARRTADGADVPGRDADQQPHQGRGHLVRRPRRSTTGTMQIGSLTAMLSYIMQILMAVMMASFLAMMAAARGGLRRTHHRGTRDGLLGGAAARAEVLRRRTRDRRARGAQFQFPGAEEPVLRDITFRAEPGRPPPSSAPPVRVRPPCST